MSSIQQRILHYGRRRICWLPLRVAAIFPAAFLVAIALGQVNLGLIFYVRERFAASPTQVGWLAAAWSLSYVTGCVLVRPRVDRFRAHSTTASAAVTMATLTLLMQAVPAPGGLPWIFLLHACSGLALSHYWPPLMGWLTSTQDEGRQLGRLVSVYNCFWSSGMVISPFLAGWLSEQHPRWPLAAGSTAFLASGAVIVGVSTLIRGVKHTPVVTEDCDDSDGNRRDTGTPLRFPAWTGLFATFVGLGVLLAVFPVGGREELDLSKRVVGGLLLVRALANASGFVLLAQTSFWHFRLAPMVLAQILAATAFAALSVTDSLPAMAMLMVLLGATLSMGYSGSIFHGVSGSASRAGRMAVHESLLAFGIVTGSALGGMLYDATTLGTVYLTCAVLMVTVAALQLIIGMKGGCFGGTKLLP